MKKLILRFLPIADMLLAPFVYPSAWLLKKVRCLGIQNFPYCKHILMKIGVFPIADHYYDPQFDNRKPKQPFSQDRILPGIRWNTAEQINKLNTFSFSKELADISQDQSHTLEFYMNNGSFISGDAEYWYQLIRSVKPRRIFEIGSGNSTLMAIKAIRRNMEEDPNYNCKHVCIEPYQMPWLEQTDITVIRQKVEDVGLPFFSELEESDILFIDSSHIIRPQGDVLFEYLELLPTLKKGVIVHVHDVFSPKDYPKSWLVDKVILWNEQYLLEAFLTNNDSWKIIGALNYLHHNYYEQLKSVAPFLTPDSEPGSFYIQRIS
ncbi:MAG: class I SAM-dependent methyltransferase [Pseudomonadota bacterium]